MTLSRAVTPAGMALNIERIATGGQRVVVAVEHSPAGLEFGEAAAFYTFDHDLRILDAETTDSYHMVHLEAERRGKLARPYSADVEKELFPVLSWDGTKFVEITGTQGR